MMRKIQIFVLALVIAPLGAIAEDKPSVGKDKLVSGMSIVGNDEAPKSLVIVPWKSSELGDTLDVTKSLKDGRGPVDRDVFIRALDYFEIRSHAAR
jgi:hypothetical protein